MIDPDARIGHVHLKVADLDRSISFYQRAFGFELQQRYGDQAAFLSAGGYHHHLGLNTWESRGGTPPPKGHTGLYHTALLFPDRASLGAAVVRVIEAGYPQMVTRVWARDSHGNRVMLLADTRAGVTVYRPCSTTDL